ncbi:hypothetical protein [Micromonospora sp. NBC_01638]|nr:hypothetical protein OG811_23285 [Micromonospora sp. NBC_01638]
MSKVVIVTLTGDKPADLRLSFTVDAAARKIRQLNVLRPSEC